MSIFTAIRNHVCAKATPRHTHNWVVVSVDQYNEIARKFIETQPDTVTGYYTEVILRCTVCGCINERTLRGHHELASLQSTEGNNGKL